jgi:hypothetical protein
MTGVRFPAGSGNLSLFHSCVQTGSVAHQDSYPSRLEFLFPSVNLVISLPRLFPHKKLNSLS